jgi:hypothetical protein
MKTRFELPEYLVGLCIAVATLGGCATTWEPSAARPVEASGLRAELTGAQGTLHGVRLRLEAAGPQRIEAVRLGSTNGPPCASSASGELVIHDATSRERIELPQELVGPAEVTADLPWQEVRGSHLTVDVESPGPTGPRCLRLPLTAPDQVLWQTHRPVWRMGASVRWDFPEGGAPGGVGQGPAIEMRWLREMGTLSPVLGLSFGGAGCRHDCPDVALSGSSDDDVTLTGTFAQLGLSLGLEHRWELGRWGLELGAGGNATMAHLQVPVGWEGPEWTALLGPYATVRLTLPDSHALTGFSTRVRGMLQGPELIVRRTSGFGRGASSAAWMFSLGWTFEGTL